MYILSSTIDYAILKFNDGHIFEKLGLDFLSAPQRI
jgi:hypothetical protein